ncbi:glutamate synthase-related protein [Paenibacillus sp. YN15]|uniref:glutamate synthase-related protein n=1 Tax=Paenibacillus sp. YN15 TaxID=1742774 RepID=UPI000DCD2027|nr:glutamate synthase-related protein [Paenibacillus sp. YN15]RAV01495.1 FMN-binding glutamate synthase family protein [Paenibacillus sp. YN15]
MIQWPKSNDVLGTVNRGNPAESGLCTLCRADCQGKCETWVSSMKGRKLLYPRDFGTVTAGSANTTHVGVSYNSLRINGFHCGSQGLPAGLSDGADDCIFPNVNLETAFGAKVKTKVRVPVMTGALGSTFIAAKYWEHFAVGAALVGFPVVVGENVAGIDKQAVIRNGRIEKAPELDRRIETYMRYYDGYGAILVQMNVEDSNNGVAEYLSQKYGDNVIVELKWGQGAKDIGGEIQVSDLDYAIFLKERGYVVDPDPTLPEVQEAYRAGAVRSFARHSRLGYTNQHSFEAVREEFLRSVTRLRELGFQRITLKTGAYGMEGLASALRLAAEAELDLLTIDGAGGGTGMSPWNMMETWGIPSLNLHAKAYEYAQLLESRGFRVPDLAFGGGLAKEDQIFKALALGAPYTKLVCLGRSLMIPGFLGANVEGALHPERRERLSGNWSALPKGVSDQGSRAEEIFAGYFDLQKKVGADEMKNIPYGAIAVWTLADKLAAGLQQLLAGARKFSVSELTRDDIFSGNRETERETGIAFMTDAGDEAAKSILKA